MQFFRRSRFFFGIFIFFPHFFLSAMDAEVERLKREIENYGYKPLEFSPKPSLNSKNGFFLGLIGGYGAVRNIYEDGKYNTQNNIEGASNTGVLQNVILESSLYMFGGKLGYQSFFRPYFGARIYGDVLLGVGSVKKNQARVGSLQYALGALNADLLGEIKIKKIFSLGMFVGFGFGLMLLGDELSNPQAVLLNPATTVFNDGSGASPIGPAESQGHILWKNLLQVDYTLNVGVSFAILNHHRFEIGIKIPVSQLRLGLEVPAAYSVRATNNRTYDAQLNKGDIEFSRTSYVTFSYIYLF